VCSICNRREYKCTIRYDEDDCGNTSAMFASVVVATNENWNPLPTLGKHKRFQQNWVSQTDECSQNAVAGPDLQPVEFYSL